MTIDNIVVTLTIEAPTIEEKIGWLKDDVSRYKGYLKAAYNLPTKDKTSREEKEEFIGRLKRGQEFHQYLLKEIMDAYDASQPYYKGGRHNVGED